MTDVVQLRRTLLDLERSEDPRLSRAATLWLSGLGGLAQLLDPAPRADRDTLLVKVAELFNVGLDSFLAALEEGALADVDATSAPAIPHLGAARFQTQQLSEVARSIAELRDRLHPNEGVANQ